MVLVVAFQACHAYRRLNSVTVMDTAVDTVTTYRVHQDGALPKDLAAELISTLSNRDPSDIVTFNGTGMGMRLLSNGIIDAHDAAEIALLHTDIFLDFALDRGFRISLEGICSGIKHTYVRTDIHTLWQSGQDSNARIACENEARAINAVHQYALKWGRLRWETASKATRSWMLPSGVRFRTADEAIGTYLDAPPDTSWMKTPPNVLADTKWALSLYV